MDSVGCGASELSLMYLFTTQCAVEVVDMTKEIGDNPEWFRGSRLNFAENLLRYDGAKVALIQCGTCGWGGWV